MGLFTYTALCLSRLYRHFIVRREVSHQYFNFAHMLFASLGSFLYGSNSPIMGTIFGLPSFEAYFQAGHHGARSHLCEQHHRR